MKNYNRTNYDRYQEDVKKMLFNLEDTDITTLVPISEEVFELIDGEDKDRAIAQIKRANTRKSDELITKFLPAVESIAKKFSQTYQAIGPMTILDLIQEGNISLVLAVQRIDWEATLEADNPIQRLQSFLSKAIKGGIRRAVDEKASPVRIPENRLLKARKALNAGDTMNPFVVEYFNTFFASIDDPEALPSSKSQNGGNLTLGDSGEVNGESNAWGDVEDPHSSYKDEFVRKYILTLMKETLSDIEFNVLRLAYGLSDKGIMNAEDIATSGIITFDDDQSETFGNGQEILKNLAIAKELNITLKNDHTNIQRVNNIKKRAIEKLKENTPSEKLEVLIAEEI